MDAIIDTLKKAGKLFYPKTKTKAVYDDNNNRLDNTLTGITDSLNSLVLKIKTRVTFDSNGQATITNSKITSNSVALAQRRTRYTPSDIVLHCECYDGGVGVVAYRANSGTKYAEALDISVIVII